jgi:hypothetical protein
MKKRNNRTRKTLWNDFLLHPPKGLGQVVAKYLGTFTLFGESKPYEVFAVEDHFALRRNRQIRYVEKEALQDWRYRYGARCLSCKKVVYSSYKHHLQWCKCLSLNCDGGHDILRTNSSDHEVVLIDLLEGKVKK